MFGLVHVRWNTRGLQEHRSTISQSISEKLTVYSWAVALTHPLDRYSSLIALDSINPYVRINVVDENIKVKRAFHLVRS